MWDFLRVLHDYFWYRWGSRGEAWPVLDDVRHAFGSPDHVSRDSVHQVVGYGPELCHLHRSLVEDMRLDMGGSMQGPDRAALCPRWITRLWGR